MSQTTYNRRHARAVPGMIDGLGPARIRTYKNSGLNAQNVWTVAAPSSVDNSSAYSVLVTGGALPSAGITATFTTDGSATQAELAAGLLAALKATDLARFFSITLSGSTITLTALAYGVAYTVTAPTNAATTNDLTVTETVNEALATEIPYGRFVVRKTNAPADAQDEARLPTVATNIKLAGVTVLTHANERSAIGEAATAGYKPSEAMDVLANSAGTDGIWVKCDAANITTETTVYIDTQAAANRGGITATSTDNLALPATCAIVEGAVSDGDGGFCCKVSVNLAA